MGDLKDSRTWAICPSELDPRESQKLTDSGRKGNCPCRARTIGKGCKSVNRSQLIIYVNVSNGLLGRCRLLRDLAGAMFVLSDGRQVL